MSDPYSAHTVLLLHLEGADGNTEFPDSSLFQKKVTRYGDTKISTGKSKWGNGSGYFDGSGDYLSVPDIGGFNDFTVEFWVYSTRESTNNFVSFSINWNLYGNSNYLYFWDGVSNKITSNNFKQGEWVHVALTRNSGVVRLFINGMLSGQVTKSTDLPSSIFLIGSYPSSPNFFSGYLQDLRITQNIARYTENFIPPSAILPNPAPLVKIFGGRGQVQVVARGALSGATTLVFFQSLARFRVVARGVLSGISCVVLPVSAYGVVKIVARSGLSRSIPLGGRAKTALQIRTNGPVIAPRLRGQRLNEQLIASVYGHPAVIRLAWALDDAPLQDLPNVVLNPSAGQPLILDIPGFQAPQDGVLHRVTIQAWQAVGERTSSRANVVVDLKPTKATALKPPKTVTATQVRDWTPYYRDLTRIEWDWGDEEPGLVEVFAYIRPVGSQNRSKRELKNISLGVVDANTRQFMAESIGIKINWSGATRVYFGVARYLNGERSPELISNEVYISASVNEDVTTPVYNPDLESGTVKTWTQAQLVNVISQQSGITTTTIQQILNAALLKIKDVVAKGGSVAIEDVGTFDVLWSDPIVRVDRVTGKTTTTPAQRNARFVPSPGFKLGTQRGSVLNDDDVTE